MQIGATEVVIFAAGAAFWMLLAAIRVSLPYLVVAPLPGGVWRESPAPAMRGALESIGHAARRIDRRGAGYGVYLEPPEKRHGGNFVAPLVEGIFDVDTLVRMADAACRAARDSVGGRAP